MDTLTTRDKLISLLRQYPVEQSTYLHEGRSLVHPAEEFANKIEALFADDLFMRVMTASAAYVTRFGGELNEQGAIRKMHEEQREFEVATIAYTQARTSDTPLSLRLKSPEQLKREMIREFIDFMVTVGGMFAVLGIDFEDVQQAARDTLAKLDSRDASTHQWNPDTKTVEKIGKPAPRDEDFNIHAQLRELGRVKRQNNRDA